MINPKILKTALVCCFIAFSASALIAQEIEKNLAISNFTGIAVSSGIDLYLTQGNTEKVTIKGSKTELEKVEVTKNADGVLTIGFKKTGLGNWNWGSKDEVKAYVTVKMLNSLSASGGSDVYTKNQLNSNSLTIKSSGGSDLKLDLVVNNLSLATSGGSDVSLKGKANKFNLAASGGSDVSAYDFITQEVVAQMSGGSDGELYAAKSISVAASGASDVSYKGTATQKSISTSGASDVTKVK